MGKFLYRNMELSVALSHWDWQSFSRSSTLLTQNRISKITPDFSYPVCACMKLRSIQLNLFLLWRGLEVSSARLCLWLQNKLRKKLFFWSIYHLQIIFTFVCGWDPFSFADLDHEYSLILLWCDFLDYSSSSGFGKQGNALLFLANLFLIKILYKLKV